jgi:branched-chain amino acid transport system ATP-binding protein
MSALLKLSGVNAGYGSVQVLSNIELEVSAGGITALLGANGAGKTTVLRCISNVLAWHTGSIAMAGQALDRLATHAVARLGIAHVPDGRGTFASISVEENLRIGAIGRRTSDGVSGDMQRVYELFPKLSDMRRTPAGLLSGGEQQMLAIGRALMLRPKVLLLDEPSFGLAPLVVSHIFRMLSQVAAERGFGILIVEQNAHLALDMADHAYVLENGRVALHGPADSLRNDPRVRSAYLGV